MLTINLQQDNLHFKDITKEDLEELLTLYNQTELNVYATGIDMPMSIKDISEKYLEVLVNTHEFFVGIFYGDDLVGVIKGRIDYENSEEAWISSILIDNQHQNKGIGKKSINAIMQLLNSSYDVKRFYIGLIAGNKIGLNFWRSMGFDYMRTIEQYIKLNNHVEDFIIMRKIVG